MAEDFAKSNQSEYVATRRSQSWFGNQIDCFLWGGALATSDSAEKNAGLVKMIIQKFGYANRPVYIGLSDPSSKNAWYWIGNRKFLGAYNDWQRGQPNNYRGIPENCVTIYVDMKWHDVPCSMPTVGICERQKGS